MRVRARSMTPDLILPDYNLPGMDGLAIRERDGPRGR
jgi:CheY-like chemotaxis protein